MILRLLITVMMLLGLAKYYLHDTKQPQQSKPAQKIENIQNQLDEIQRRQAEEKTKQLEALGL